MLGLRSAQGVKQKTSSRRISLIEMRPHGYESTLKNIKTMKQFSDGPATERWRRGHFYLQAACLTCILRMLYRQKRVMETCRFILVLGFKL
ncbi:hypothetical protein F2Q69_00021273 [Brassica cretica]|uniref:Uncharacterized protein n=1 Tax=Brassica cretica TaxID=69181 RepID=A0A8S9QNU1_BRACR|nr:hypothetical protein F2Q69_00021273 [Brassica cretica]